MPKHIPIKAAREFSRKQGLTHFILLAYDGKLNHVVTYGDTVEHCSQAAEFGNRLKRDMGWPDSLQAEPSRVKKLQEEVTALRALFLPSAAAATVLREMAAARPDFALVIHSEGILDRLQSALDQVPL